MNDDNTQDAVSRDAGDVGELSPARADGGGAATQQAMGPVMTMEIVQRYVTFERERNRRVLLWTGALSLLLVLLALVAIVSVGIFSVRHSRRAADWARQAQTETALYVADVTDVSGKVVVLEERHEDTKKELRSLENRRGAEQRQLEQNLVKFSTWVADGDSKGAEALKALEFRLREIESALSGKEKELAALREQYASVVASIASGALAPRAAGGSRVEPEQGAPDTSLDELLADFPPMGEGVPRATPVPEPDTTPERAREVTVMTFPNGEKYEGQFKDGLFHGQGTYTFSNGDEYRGAFANDKMNGQGQMKYANGNVYAGEFKDGVREGTGKLNFPNGDAYEGDFRDNDRHGSGEYRFANGATYIGDFDKNQRQGKGRYVYPTGEQYVGFFKNGKMDGYGVCTYANGKTVKGLWEGGRFVKEVEQ